MRRPAFNIGKDGICVMTQTEAIHAPQGGNIHRTEIQMTRMQAIRVWMDMGKKLFPVPAKPTKTV